MKLNKKLIDFEGKIDAYFDKCRAQEIYPDEAGLILHLGITKELYDEYKENADDKYSEYARCIDNARLRRESIIVRDIYASSSAATGKIFLARQPGNGGLTDKQAQEQKKLMIEVVIGEEFD